MTDSNLTLAQAEAQLAEAQQNLASAIERQTITDCFPRVDELQAVVAVSVSFDQFVSYDEEGLLIGVFSDRDRAEKYASEAVPPLGKVFVVRPVALLS